MVDFVDVTAWEHRDFEPDIHVEDDTERDVTSDPTDPRDQLPVLSVDVEVGIAEVAVIDPFEHKENPVVRALRDQLLAAQAELETERRARDELEAKLSGAIDATRDTP